MIYISTHTSRVGCDCYTNRSRPNTNISTHTSRVGCDSCKVDLAPLYEISTHTSRVGCDKTSPWLSSSYTSNFYSHIPCGMWLKSSKLVTRAEDFYSHIPCGMWPAGKALFGWWMKISTHTSRVGCDRAARNWWSSQIISTHTSRVGCDAHRLSCRQR